MKIRPIALVGLALTLTACRLPYIPMVTKAPPAAVARVVDGGGRTVGQAVLVQQSKGVRILVDLTGVEQGVRAVHIHEAGQCEPPSFQSAGGHFNPTRSEHGSKNPRGPHAGDLPDITVDAAGRGHLETTATRVSLDKGPTSLVEGAGTAIVVHERPDDLQTDPDGGSGARLYCGVIVLGGRQ